MEISVELILAVLGIAVTIVTFIVFYSKTIGARKERAKNAYSEIVKALHRNLIIEENLPTFDELNRIISSKVSEHRIRNDDLPPEIDYINYVYTKIFENELISAKKKTLVLNKINELIEAESTKAIVEAPTVVKKKEEMYTLSIISLISILLGMMVFTSSYGYASSISIDIIFPLFIALTGMILSILMLQILIKNRTSGSLSMEYSERSQERRKFEESINKKIKSYGFTIGKNYYFEYEGRKAYPDIYAKKNNKEYIFEIKYFQRIIPSYISRNLGNMADAIKKENKNIILVLITKGKLHLPEDSKTALKNWNFIIDYPSLKKLKDI